MSRGRKTVSRRRRRKTREREGDKERERKKKRGKTEEGKGKEGKRMHNLPSWTSTMIIGWKAVQEHART